MSIKYFDHSATTSVDKDVLEEMLPYFMENYGNPSSLYKLGIINKEKINIARMRIASILNCKVNELYFTSCGSESNNLIIKGIAFANRNKGNHIITSKIEHPAVLETCKTLEKFGFKVTYLTPMKNGIINLEDLERAITKNTILISIMYANNEIGTIQPIKDIGDLAQKYGIYFHSDCVQAIGNIKVDIQKEKIGALSISAHKFYGPKGIGLAYINENIPFYRIQDGGHQEKNKRAGTENVPGIIGLSKAMELADQNLSEYCKKIKELRDYYFYEIQRRIPYIRINGDMEKRLAGNANVCFSGIDGSRLVYELDERNICASSGSACSAGLFQPSHVLLAIGVPRNIAQSSLRISFGKENSLEDTKYLIDNIEEIVSNLRKR